MKENSVIEFSYRNREYWKQNKMRLENKKIVVTAGAQGIGKATAIAFANEGADVLATDINEEKLNELSKDYPNIKIANLDATNKIEVEKFCSSLDNIDILFHAVGLFIMELLWIVTQMNFITQLILMFIQHILCLIT